MRPARPQTGPLFALALGLGACSGSGDADPDAGTPAGPDDAYFGFADRTCSRFKASPGDVNTFAIEQAVDTKLEPGVRLFHLTFRQNGHLGDELWLEVTPDALLLHRRRAATNTMLTGLTDPYNNVDANTIFTPALTWLKKGIETGDTLTTTGSARVSGGGKTETVPVELHVMPFAPEPIAAGSATVDATKFQIGRSMNGGADIVDKVWLAPGTGIVKIDPAGSAIDAQTLVSSGPMAEGETCD